MSKVILNMLSEIAGATPTVFLLDVPDRFVLTIQTWLQLVR